MTAGGDHIGLYFVIAVLVFFTILIVVLSIVQFRRVAPNAFRCTRCGAEFRKAAHHDFPDRCPSCRATDWAAPIP